MKTVRFVSHCEIYMPGEEAVFPEDKAKRLIAGRAAVAVETATAPPEKVAEVQADEVSAVPPQEVAVVPGARRFKPPFAPKTTA